MKISELKKVKDRRPFQPYVIRMADGREIKVTHPDAISWGDEGGRILSYISPSDDWELIDLALVTSLASVPGAGSKAGGNGA
ncbi:MAG TPA: hypothetical protein VHA57_03480 [Actinomycetota bacterium]|nr:hypothetical protein [Actinomycetota bacterium]